jgi:hypothetical protein
MGQGIMISRSDPEDYFDEGTADALDEDVLRRRLADLSVDVADEGQQVTVHFGSGSAFWQAELLRDDDEALVILDGELYYDAPYSARDVRAAFEGLRDLAAVVGARLWVEGEDGPEVLTPAAWADEVSDGQARATLP